ncbi:MAG TPA: hypothetical protein VHT75_05480 [Acidimicrobiales bacterium]|nr:hypothetical protein [Acidimicrobiales bacterium]
MPSSFDPNLLPTLREMRATWSGPEITLRSFINIKGSMELGYAFAATFWPDLIEMHEGIFIAEQYNDGTYRRWFDAFDGDLTKVEAMLNHLHVADLFMNGPSDDDVPVEVYRRFADVLAGCWRAAAQEQFPRRRIQVYSWDDVGDFQVTMSVDRRDSAT